MINLASIVAILNHPITQAIFDIGNYAFQKHIGPAMAATANPTPEDIKSTVNEYAMGDIVDVEPIKPSFNETGVNENVGTSARPQDGP